MDLNKHLPIEGAPLEADAQRQLMQEALIARRLMQTIEATIPFDAGFGLGRYFQNHNEEFPQGPVEEWKREDFDEMAEHAKSLADVMQDACSLLEPTELSEIERCLAVLKQIVRNRNIVEMLKAFLELEERDEAAEKVLVKLHREHLQNLEENGFLKFFDPLPLPEIPPILWKPEKKNIILPPGAKL